MENKISFEKKPGKKDDKLMSTLVVFALTLCLASLFVRSITLIARARETTIRCLAHSKFLTNDKQSKGIVKINKMIFFFRK